MRSYVLLDSGQGKKFELFGSVRVVRPCSTALWSPKELVWDYDVSFSREKSSGWNKKNSVPHSWEVFHGGVKLKVSLTEFGHLGLFPEHYLVWERAVHILMENPRPKPRILNLFAYSGAATVACALSGALVTHVDSSKGMTAWARENAALNGVSSNSVRWIVDDVCKFVRREIRRGAVYDAIIVDPPSFGHGKNRELFKLEKHFPNLLNQLTRLLSTDPLFFFLTAHSAGVTPIILKNILEEYFPLGVVSGELTLPDKYGRLLSCGSFAKWEKDFVRESRGHM